jgi:hypothetical protein
MWAGGRRAGGAANGAAAAGPLSCPTTRKPLALPLKAYVNNMARSLVGALGKPLRPRPPVDTIDLEPYAACARQLARLPDLPPAELATALSLFQQQPAAFFAKDLVVTLTRMAESPSFAPAAADAVAAFLDGWLTSSVDALLPHFLEAPGLVARLLEHSPSDTHVLSLLHTIVRKDGSVRTGSADFCKALSADEAAVSRLVRLVGNVSKIHVILSSLLWASSSLHWVRHGLGPRLLQFQEHDYFLYALRGLCSSREGARACADIGLGSMLVHWMRERKRLDLYDWRDWSGTMRQLLICGAPPGPVVSAGILSVLAKGFGTAVGKREDGECARLLQDLLHKAPAAVAKAAREPGLVAALERFAAAEADGHEKAAAGVCLQAIRAMAAAAQ